MSGKEFYQMDMIINALIDLVDQHKEDIRGENVKRYKEFLNGLRYEDYGRSNDSVYKRIDNLIRQENGKVTFVLGAGVSIDFGVPNWEELIFRINFSKYWQHIYGNAKNSPKLYELNSYRKIKDNDVRDKLKNGLFKINSNLYEWAQYAENNFYQDEKRKERYNCLTRSSRTVTKTLDNTLYSVVEKALYYQSLNIEYENTSLGLICAIAKKKKIERIITYNYDDCLEYCWGKAESELICLPVFDKEQLFEDGTGIKNQCEIYHVHGFIPYFSEFKEGGKKFGLIEKAFNSYDGKKLILTEISYDDMQDEIYKWRNDIQVNTLLRYSCIFTGFSATDVNFKRIVKQLSKGIPKVGDMERPDHYITICVDDYFNNFYYNTEKLNISSFIEKIKLPDRDKIYPFAIAALEMMIDRKEYLQRYGIYPLFTTIVDLPRLLSELKNRINDSM